MAKVRLLDDAWLTPRYNYRIDAVGRLFRAILDLSTHQDDREKWRIATGKIDKIFRNYNCTDLISLLGDIYRYFFAVLWTDDCASLSERHLISNHLTCAVTGGGSLGCGNIGR